MRIQYVAEWNLRDRTKSWSGTTYYLRDALEKRSQILNIDANFSKTTRALAKVHKKLNSQYDTNFDVKLLSRRSNRLARKLDFTIPTIEIGDCVDAKNAYVYQDLNLEALNYVKTNMPRAFAASGFQNISAKDLDERTKFQNILYGKGLNIFSMSHWLADFINSKTPFTAHYVGGGINSKPIRLDYHTRKKQVLFVGRDFERKGGSLVVSAFMQVLKKIPTAKLVIVGPATRPSSVPNSDNIEFLGDVPYGKVSELMTTSSVLCMPSIFEAYGLVFVEAMANGMSIIARDEFEMHHFVKEGSGTLITSGSNEFEIAQLRDQMVEQLLNNSYSLKAAKLMGSVGEEHSWNRVAGNMLNAIMDCGTGSSGF